MAISKEFLNQQFSLGPKNLKSIENEKKEKKIFATFPFKGCKPLKYYIKIAYLSVIMTKLP